MLISIAGDVVVVLNGGGVGGVRGISIVNISVAVYLLGDVGACNVMCKA